MNRIPLNRLVCGALIVALTYTPLLGSYNGTVAAAQTAQNTTSNNLYDANGNLTQITDPLGHVTNMVVDGLNRTTQRQQPAPTTGGARPLIKYAYDGIDHVSSVTDPRNLATAYTWDGLDNQSTLASPDTGTTGMTFDEAGNLKSRTDARGKTTSYSYDVLNRLTSVTYASGVATVFEYDGGASPVASAIGKVSRMTDESGLTNYSFDPLGRLANVVQSVSAGGSAQSYSVAYGYGSDGSANGKRTSITYPSGNRISYTFDSAGRIGSISLNPGMADGTTDIGTTIALLTNIQYAPFGGVSGWTWGNSTPDAPNLVARTYDLDGRLTSYPIGNGIVRTVTYDAASRITAMTHAGAGGGVSDPAVLNQSFGYDNLDRLTAFTASNTSQSFQYDASGNRTQAVFGASNYSNSVSPTSNRLTAAGGPLPSKSYAYDSAGNITGDGISTFTYSDRGRMNTSSSTGATYSYFYNGLDQRVRKVGVATTDYVYDDNGHLLGEYNSASDPRQETVFLGDLPVAVLKKDTTTGALNAYAPYYVFADHLLAPRLITTSSDNAVVWRWDGADPFGVVQPLDNPSGVGAFEYNPRFPGQYYDKETNLHYNTNRDYDPQTGRYIESDPVGLQGGINTYAYVGGNPLSFTDPSGLCIEDFCIGEAILAARACAMIPACAAGVGAIAAGGIYSQANKPPRVTHPDAAAEHDAYKDAYRQPPPPNQDECERLKWQLKREQDLLAARMAWDAKWGNHHPEAITQSQSAIKNINDRLKKAGCLCP